MRQCQDQNAFRLRTVDQGEWEVLQEDLPGVCFSRGARLRKGQRAHCSLLDGRRKLNSDAGTRLRVKLNFVYVLAAGRRQKTSTSHFAIRRASAKTSSAG